MAQAIPYILMAAAGAVQVMGTLQKAQAASDAAKYNAKALEQAAQVERQQAGAREEAQRRHARDVFGSQRAAFAQAGTGAGGSALDVQQQSAVGAELDALTLRYEGDLRAKGMETQATQERYAGKLAKQQGNLAALGTILGTASSMYGFSGAMGGGAGGGGNIQAVGGSMRGTGTYNLPKY